MGKRAKEFMVLVLAVIALITAVFTFRGTPPPAGAAAHQTAPAPATAPAPTATRPPAAQASPALVPPKDSNRNPFAAPRGAPAALKAPPTPPQPNRMPTQVVSAPPVAAPAAVPAVSPVPAATAAPAMTGPLPAAPLAAAPVPTTPTLSGFVVDSSGRPTAVIRDGNRRHFARAGDEIAGKYRVQSISGQQVVLTSAQGKLILTMGGNR